jgi:23S rRNA (guanosine2251-2'-O)-methyltransferase
MVLRDKKAQQICQQRNRQMTPKSAKNFNPGKNSQRNRRVGNRKSNINLTRQDTREPATNALRFGKAPLKPPQNSYFIWGRHAVKAALINPYRRIAAVYVTDDAQPWLNDVLGGQPTRRHNNFPAPQSIDRKRLDAIGGANEKAVHQGIAAAVWPLEPPHLDDFLTDLSDSQIRLVLLDNVSDPRNVGAIIRSARAFNVAGIITTYRNSAEENGVLARTASGALEHIPLIRVVNLSRAIKTLQTHGFTVAGLAGDGDSRVADLADHKRLGIMLGAEGSGLRRLSRDHCDFLVSIEIEPTADSLNVSNAAAIALYAASLVPSK